VDQFELSNTPKALANLSPAVGAQRQPWDVNHQERKTLKAFAICGVNFQGFIGGASTPGLSLRSNRWARISQRLRRFTKKCFR
jgi:hypothetical protein